MNNDSIEINTRNINRLKNKIQDKLKDRVIDIVFENDMIIHNLKFSGNSNITTLKIGEGKEIKELVELEFNATTTDTLIVFLRIYSGDSIIIDEDKIIIMRDKETKNIIFIL